MAEEDWSSTSLLKTTKVTTKGWAIFTQMDQKPSKRHPTPEEKEEATSRGRRDDFVIQTTPYLPGGKPPRLETNWFTETYRSESCEPRIKLSHVGIWHWEKEPQSIWHWRPVGHVCRNSTGLGEKETPLLKGAHRLSRAPSPRAKQSLHRNLVKTECSSWRTSWENRGECGLLRGRDIGNKALRNIQQHAFLWRVAILAKSGPTSQCWEAPGQTAIQVGSQPHPSVNKLPKEPSGTQTPLIPSRDKAPPTRGRRIRISPTNRWAGISPSHQEAYSKAPYQPQPQGGQTPEGTEATILFPVKRSLHQKPIKMKRQRTITLMREKGKPPEYQLSDEESLSL